MDKSREMMPGANGGMLRRGGPGRPRADFAEAREYLRTGLFANGETDTQGILDVLMGQARKGNIRAIELCLWYGIGKPTETVDLTIKVREAATRLAEQLGIDDGLVQSQVDALISGGKR